MDIEEPTVTKSKTESELLRRDKPSTEIAEPTRAKPRRENEELK